MYRVPLAVLLISAALSAQSMSFDLLTVPTSAPPQSVVAGDFNGDGKPDLAVTENSSVEILLNNGNGTFRSAHVISVSAAATRIVKADFNGDGKLDLAVSGGADGQVVVLLGNGDGTFQAPADVGAQSPEGQVSGAAVPGLAVGDVNGDGKPDLILGPYTLAASSIVSVLRGKGDGTFQSAVNTTIDRVDSPRVAVADYNGDGRADLFVTGVYPSTPNLLLFYGPAGLLTGNADGTFAVSFWSTDESDGYQPVAADLNGNGKPDFILLDHANEFPWLDFDEYLDGSLTRGLQTVNGPIDEYHGNFVSMAAADMNGDGKTDLLMVDSKGDLYTILGAGDGSFLSPPNFPQSTAYLGGTSASTYFSDPYNSLAAADFFGTGKPAVIVAIAGSNLALLKPGTASPPGLSPADVVNPASMTAIAAVPGSLMAIFGTGLANGSGSLQAATDVISPESGFVPNTLFGLRVYVNGVQAPLLYASPTQANIQVPWEVAGQTQATLAVTRNGASQAITIPIGVYDPGLFTMTEAGTGQAAAIIGGTSEIPAPLGTFPGSRPIRHGEILALYGTGLGPLDRMDLATGEVTPLPSYYYTNGGPLRNTTTTPTVTVGGVAATVQFSGFAPEQIGMYQVNVLIPDASPTGNAVPVRLSIGGAAANTVTIAIQ